MAVENEITLSDPNFWAKYLRNSVLFRCFGSMTVKLRIVL